MKGLLVLLVASTAMGYSKPDIQYTGEVTKKLTANGITVDIYPTATVTTGSGTTELHLTGAGIREEKVLFIKEQVYAAAHYLATPDKMDPQAPMHSVRNSSLDILQLTLYMDLRAAQIRSSFEDALEMNDVDLSEETVQKLLAEIKYDMQAGSRLTIVAEGDDLLHFLAPWDYFFGHRAEVAYEMWLPFFNIPSDAEMNVLKHQLIGSKQ